VSLLARAQLASAGDDPVRSEIHERPPGRAKATREQRPVTSVVPVEMMEKEIRHCENRREEREDERNYQEWGDEEEGEDRERRAHQEPDQNDQPDLTGTQPDAGHLGDLGGYFGANLMGFVGSTHDV
jgi:hypothetical protein